jgi:hypothetical protein
MKTLLLDATALGPTGSRRLVHCAKINEERERERENANGMVRIVSDRRLYRNARIQGKGACHRCRMRPAQSWL